MKSKIFTSIVMIFWFVQNVLSCPVWRVGKMYIIDENNKPVKDVVVWRFYNSNDSFEMKKSDYHYLDKEDTDTTAYYFWSSGFRRIEAKSPKKYLLIKAKGYADVTINELRFIRVNYDNEESLPTLIVKMYSKKLVKKGEMFTLMNNYIVEKKLEVKDSMTIDFKDYIESIIEANAVVDAQRVSTYAVKTFPNPVKDKLNIEITALVRRPYKAILMDVQGKFISETQLITQSSILDMEWEVAGIYFIQVYDPEGTLLYAFKFFKT